jgi:hypothetical protein
MYKKKQQEISKCFLLGEGIQENACALPNDHVSVGSAIFLCREAQFETVPYKYIFRLHREPLPERTRA